MPRSPTTETLLFLLRSRGPTAPGPLCEALDLSAPTLRKLAQAAGLALVVVGKTRSARYVATRAVGELGRRAPLFAVDEHGGVARLAALHFAWGQGTVCEWAVPRVRGPVSEHGDLPWFLDDARPQGFLGRLFVAEHPELALPPLGRWSADDSLRALALAGADQWGNLLVGERALERFLKEQTGAAAQARLWPLRSRASRYPRAARQVLGGGPAGSSAGGEQPKFTATLDERGAPRAVIVKFSPPLSTPVGRRWADLLACEHLALEHLGAHGLPAAKSALFDFDDRRFLEVTRFDRHGLCGRGSVVSLAAADAELVGRGQGWADVAAALESGGHLSSEDAARVAALEAMGRLIANSDRHLGNLSLFWNPRDETFVLAPIYDMLPMAFAPAPSGELVDRPLPRALPDATILAQWPAMHALAAQYWTAVAASPLVSPGFKKKQAAAARAAMS